MDLLGRIVLPALIAGILAGLLLTGLQYIEVIPLIYEAESYETAGAGGHAHDEIGASDVHGSHSHNHDHGDAAWAPDDGLERFAMTLLANVVAAIGFGLLLAVAFSVLAARERVVAWRAGLLWGLAGFGIFNFAPALGLPPELPGSEAAALESRQIWWIATVVLTALGLGLIAFARPVYLRALGLVPLALPHIVGAPAPEEHGGLAPAEMAERYIYASLITSALFWIALGSLTAAIHRRFGGTKQAGFLPDFGTPTAREK
jgi:cobalt transporter subunit CbtA